MNTPESLYIHIPFCVSKCSYCDFFSIGCGDNSVPQKYINALCEELSYRLSFYNVSRLKTIYIGGGTPSLLSIKQIIQIQNFLEQKVTFSSDLEFTIEVNPDDITEKFLTQLSKTRITRISCGIQTLNKDALEYANRRSSLEQNIQALELFNKFWKKDLSLDLICGLPYETEVSFLEGLQKLLEYNPDHISMYSLTIEEETPFGRQVDSGKIKIDSEFQDELWLKGRQFLTDNGYLHYEVSNFSKPGKECSHNVVYWNHAGYIGAGSGACGTVYNKDGSGKRWTNKTDIQGYIKFWNEDFDKTNLFEESEIIDAETSRFEFFMMGFRKLSGISDIQYYEIFGEKIPEEKMKIFEKWKNHSLMEIESEERGVRYRLNKDGILLLNRFLEELL